MLSTVADVVSIIGVLVTGYVALTIYRIERRYVRQALLESCLPQLRAAAKNIKAAAKKSDDSKVRQELQRCRAVLSHWVAYSDSVADTRNAISVIDRVNAYHGSQLIRELDDALDVIGGEAARLELTRLKLNWSRKNG
jgi:hypothetical protein